MRTTRAFPRPVAAMVLLFALVPPWASSTAATTTTAWRDGLPAADTAPLNFSGDA